MGRLVLKRASSFSTRTVQWLWDQRIPLGEITLIAGREGAGKGLLVTNRIAQVTTGKLKGEFYGKPRSVAIAAHEDSWESTILPRLKVAGADVDRVFHISVSDDDGDRKMMIPEDLELIASVTKRNKDIVMLVLDPLMSTIESSIDIYKSPKVRPVLEAFRDSLERANIAGVGIVHFNKSSDGDILTKIANSRAIVEVSRAVLAVAEDRDPTAERGTVVVSQPRNNRGRTDLDDLAFIKTGVEFTADDGRTSSVGCLKWISSSYHKSASEALVENPDKRQTTSDLDRVLDWMRITERAVSAAEVAEGTGIREANVRQAFSRALHKGMVRKSARGKYAAL